MIDLIGFNWNLTLIGCSVQYNVVGGTFEQVGAAGRAVGHVRPVRRDRVHRFDSSARLCVCLHAPAAGRLSGPHQIGRPQTAGQSHHGQLVTSSLSPPPFLSSSRLLSVCLSLYLLALEWVLLFAYFSRAMN